MINSISGLRLDGFSASQVCYIKLTERCYKSSCSELLTREPPEPCEQPHRDHITLYSVCMCVFWWVSVWNMRRRHDIQLAHRETTDTTLIWTTPSHSVFSFSFFFSHHSFFWILFSIFLTLSSVIKSVLSHSVPTHMHTYNRRVIQPLLKPDHVSRMPRTWHSTMCSVSLGVPLVCPLVSQCVVHPECSHCI